jgi:iron complex outermembrane receptor protein
LPLIILLVIFLYFDIGTLAAEEEGEKPGVVLPQVVVPGEQEITNYVGENSTTATKTDMPIGETPQSVEVINRDVINDQGAVRLQDTVHNVSGVIPGDSFLVPFLVRGFRADILRDGFVSSTAIFFNIFQEELVNVERVEFLKGPASILYGNTAPGGIINIITKRPLPYFYASAEGTIGNFDFYSGALDVSTPLNKQKSLLFRVNASYLNSGSFRDFSFSDRVFIAPVLSWWITPRMVLTVDGEYFHVNQPFDDGIVAVGNGVAGIPLSRNLGEPSDSTTFKSYLVKATLETKLSEAVSLRNAFRYYRTDAKTFDHRNLALLPDNRTLLRFIFDSTINDGIYTTQNEMRVNIKTWSADHKLLFGLEYVRENFDEPVKLLPASSIDIFNPVYGVKVPFNPADVPLLWRSGKLNDLGFYVQDQISLFDKVFVLAGLRYDYLNQSLEDNSTTPDQSFNNIGSEENEFSPRLGILYKPIRDVSLYADYSRSFNLLLVTAFTANGSILNPETATQYEGGVKFYLLDGRISSNMAVYRIIKKNALTPDPVNGGIFAVQVKKERSQGFEFDLTAEPLRGWNIIASYAFTDAEVINDNFFKNGNRVSGVPKNSSSIWMTYKLYKGILEGLGIGMGLIAVGKREGDLQNTFELDGFLRLDAALYYERQIRKIARVKASINFKNITDADYILNSDSRVNIIPGEPFTVLATLRVEF